MSSFISFKNSKEDSNEVKKRSNRKNPFAINSNSFIGTGTYSDPNDSVSQFNGFNEMEFGSEEAEMPNAVGRYGKQGDLRERRYDDQLQEINDFVSKIDNNYIKTYNCINVSGYGVNSEIDNNEVELSIDPGKTFEIIDPNNKLKFLKKKFNITSKLPIVIDSDKNCVILFMKLHTPTFFFLDNDINVNFLRSIMRFKINESSTQQSANFYKEVQLLNNYISDEVREEEYEPEDKMRKNKGVRTLFSSLPEYKNEFTNPFNSRVIKKIKWNVLCIKGNNWYEPKYTYKKNDDEIVGTIFTELKKIEKTQENRILDRFFDPLGFYDEKGDINLSPKFGRGKKRKNKKKRKNGKKTKGRNKEKNGKKTKGKNKRKNGKKTKGKNKRKNAKKTKSINNGKNSKNKR